MIRIRTENIYLGINDILEAVAKIFTRFLAVVLVVSHA
jgi:hypothetical protein